MYLFFDTETTGLPLNWKAPITDSENWPRMVQLAWIEYGEDEELLSEANHIIRPDNYTIPEAASRIHGITQQRALSEGASLRNVLEDFNAVLKRNSLLIAHNISFDESIIAAEYFRLDMQNAMMFSRHLCTKELSTEFCKLPSRYGYKWPTLQELHNKLFGASFDEAHNALIDVRVCAKCFFELKKKGQITDSLIQPS